MAETYVVYHKPTMTKVGWSNKISGIRLGWDVTPGGDHAYMTEKEWNERKK